MCADAVNALFCRQTCIKKAGLLNLLNMTEMIEIRAEARSRLPQSYF